MVDLKEYSIDPLDVNPEDLAYIASKETAKAAYKFLVRTVRRFGDDWENLDESEKAKWVKAFGEIESNAFWHAISSVTRQRDTARTEIESKVPESKSGTLYKMSKSGMPEKL